MNSLRYEHRQWSWIPLAVTLFATAGVALGSISGPPLPRVMWLVPVTVAAVSALMATLRVSIDQEQLRWHFGPGFWRKALPLADITAVEITRTSFWNGWGIRHTRRGWLYNVAGFDAVRVCTRDGRAVLLGTDEPRKLAGAVRRAAGLP